MVATILVEFLESGAILTTASFQPLNLFGETGASSLFKLVLLAIFITFIIYFVVIQVREAINKDLKEYLSEFWSYIEWCIIVTALIAFAMFVMRLVQANKVLEFFKKTKGYDVIRLQKVNNINTQLTYSLGACVFFSSIKLLKIFRFNTSISILGWTLQNCFLELISFSVAFFIIWFAFVQLMFMFYGSHLQGYLSLLKTMATSFQVMVGKSSLSDINGLNSLLAPIIYSTYNVIILYFVLNIFVSIIIDSFEKMRMRALAKRDELDFLGYARKKLEKYFVMKRSSNMDKLLSHKDYKDHMSILSSRIDTLVHMVFRVILIYLFC